MLALALLGCALVLLGAYLSTRLDIEISLGLALLYAAFAVAATWGFLAYPHLAVAATVIIFALIPLLRWFTWPEVGAAKDLLVLAAGAAAIIVFASERRMPDRWVLGLVLALLGLYAVNVGGGHGTAWAHGIRLVGEPLVLLLAGLTLPQPRRTLRYAMGALILTGCVVAAYGIVQQIVGKWTLVESWGYSFTEQVRSLAGGQFRSFGTLDDAFGYAALLLFGIAAAFFWLRLGLIAWGVGLLMLVGVEFSFVRTAALILIAFAALALLRREFRLRDRVAVGAVLATAGMALAIAGGAQSEPVRELSERAGSDSGKAERGTSSSPVAKESPAGGNVGSRLSTWERAVGDDAGEWLIGRGVGEVGTAADRARLPTIPSRVDGREPTEWVDSGYVVTIADVGAVGLAFLLALLGRVIVLAVKAARRGARAGWVALAFLAALMIDALTRESFTGFPTAFLGLLLIGLALGAAREDSSPGAPRVTATAA